MKYSKLDDWMKDVMNDKITADPETLLLVRLLRSVWDLHDAVEANNV